ncbi:DNA-binding response regulator [Roseovarius sp. A46]|jgi:DNA-binding NarL/FixJ family response regulator|uniref:response regulator transcription factor n=1 Tax=Roseovarius TaxID=74030 RepID=UPI000CE24E78|nr:MULTISPECIES: response regulator transcription factor [Roseovarius]RXV66572.1 DNA-binding response regulator [Roseovarius sp. A46]HAW46738.1 DNA-binding response regulator [Roseovarius sp.]
MSRVLLADDHDLVRDTLAAYLRSEGGFDVAVAGRFDDALAMVRAQDGFDLVLLDYRMPGMAALAGLARMREQAGCPVAILSGTAPPEVARRALRAGAAGFLPKTLAPRALISAVRRILGGDTFAPCDFLNSDRDPGAEADIALTARERDVLTGVSDGKSNKEIARDLSIQEVTVKLHLKTLSRKLGARNRTHAAMLARDMGLA